MGFLFLSLHSNPYKKEYSFHLVFPAWLLPDRDSLMIKNKFKISIYFKKVSHKN